MSPIRIRFEYTKYPHWGGRSGYTQILRHLNPQHYHVIAHGAPDNHEDLEPWLTPFQPWLSDRIRRGRMPWYKLSDLTAEAEAYQSLRAGEFDIIHFLDAEHSGQFLPRIIKCAARSNVRSVATFHQPPKFLDKLVNPDLLRWFDAILLVSPSQLPFFTKHVPAERLHVLLHGIDADFFHPSRKLNRSNRIRCITTGHWLRDWDTFKAVAAKCNDILFDVVTGRDIGFEEFPNVSAYSEISDDHLGELYRSADVLFLPLTESTANNSLLEGIASGLPAVTTDLEATHAYLPEGAGLFVNARDADGFVTALRRLQQDVELRHRLSRCARARAEELAWTKWIRQYEAFYETLLNAAAVTENPKFWESPTVVGPSEIEAVELNPKLKWSAEPARMSPVAYALLDSGSYDEARAAFEMLVSAFPKYSQGYAGLARTAEELWDWRTAIADWDRYLERGSNACVVEGASRKARCLTKIGLMSEAKDLFSSITPEFEGWEGLGQLAEMQGTLDAAAVFWVECTKRHPDRLEGFLGHANILLKQQRFNESDQVLSHAIAVWPESMQVSAHWAQAPAAYQDCEAANERWAVVLSRFGNDPYIAWEYAKHIARTDSDLRVAGYLEGNSPICKAALVLSYYSMIGNYSTAIKQARSIVAWKPKKNSYRLLLANLLTAHGSRHALQEALTTLRQLSTMSPEDMSVKHKTVEVYIRLGLISEAYALLQTISAEDRSVEVELLHSWAGNSREHSVTSEYGSTALIDFGLLDQWSQNLFEKDLAYNRIEGWSPPVAR